MSRLLSIRPAYCIFLTSLLILGGCQVTPDESKAPKQVELAKPIALPDVESAAGGDKGLSPLEQHMLARKDVDPVHINHKNRFTKTVEDYRQKELADAAEIEEKMLKIESDPIKKQGQAKTYVEEILAKHKARQDALGQDEIVTDSKVDDTAKVIVPRKPQVAALADSGSEPEPVFAATRVATSHVTNLRIGQHPGKTRIVIDVSDKTQFQTAFEDNGKMLVVNMPATSWDATPKTKVSGQSLVQGYDATNTPSGAVVKIALNAQGRLAYQNAMKPDGDRGNRIVLDVVER